MLRTAAHLALLCGLVGQLACATTGGGVLDKPEEPKGKAVTFGADGGEGNIIAVQPFMHANDYASDWMLSAKLENYLEAAKKKGWLGDKTLVVFPEGIGTWLVAVGEEESISQARTIDDVRKLLSQQYVIDYWTKMPFAGAGDKGLHTIFRIKAEVMAKAYQKLFRKMARDYKVTILAGSIVLPGAEVVAGEIEIDPDGELYSCAYLFGPDGMVLGQGSCKIFPSGVEQSFISAVDASTLPVVETSVGRVGVLLGSDSWYPENYASFKAKGVDLVLVPAAYPVPEGWRAPWEGFGEATAPPPGVQDGDLGSLPGHDAWLKYGMPARLGSAGTSVGIAVFMRGRIWDLQTDGQTTVVKGGEILEGPHLAAPVVSNIWLGNATPAPAAQPPEAAEAAAPETGSDDAEMSPPPPPPDTVGSKKKKKKRRRRRR